MKIKKKSAIAAAALLTMTNFSACDNRGYNVYGPPEIEEWEYEENDTETVSNDDTAQSETETDSNASEETEGDEQQ